MKLTYGCYVTELNLKLGDGDEYVQLADIFFILDFIWKYREP